MLPDGDHRTIHIPLSALNGLNKRLLEPILGNVGVPTIMLQMPSRPIPIKPRILVIERDIELQKRIARSLDGLYTIDLTSSGALALLLMKDYRYSCILASTELPNRHRGTGIVKAIRSMPGGRYVPIVATASNDTKLRNADGFVASITLPGDVGRIDDVILAVLEAWD